MVKSLQRWTKPTHTVGTTIAVPHKRFNPPPTMSPLEIARMQGAEARRLNRSQKKNPYTDKLAPNNGQLAAEWMKGYGS